MVDLTAKTYALTAFLMLAWTAFAGAPSADPTTLVPGGEVVQMKKDEVKVRTEKGTLVEIELYANGEFEEASGHALAQGDVLVPGAGLLSLSDAYDRVTKQGFRPVGEWSLEKTVLSGWQYEFNGFENGRKMEYGIDAQSGKVVSSRADD